MSTGSIALIAVLVLALLAAAAMAFRAGGRESATQPMLPDAGAPPARWYQVLAAACLLLLLAAAVITLVVTQLSPDSTVPGADATWRDESRAVVFVTVMLAAAALALAAFVVFFFTRRARRSTSTDGIHQPAAEGVEAAPAYASPAGARLIGLLGLAVALLVLAWVHLSPGEQYALMLQLVYPAGFAVALVMLFDKASRAWNPKTTPESVREWLLCDVIVLLLVLGFLNLLRYPTSDQYAGLFWDLVHISGFFVTFWMLDRKRTRYRFLLAYGYVIALPILLLIWRTVQEVPVAEELSWWSTVWPFFTLAIIFFVLEIIALTATRGTNHHAIPALKDALFVLLYAIALLIAMPAGG